MSNDKINLKNVPVPQRIVDKTQLNSEEHRHSLQLLNWWMVLGFIILN